MPLERTKVNAVDSGPTLGLFLAALGPRPKAGYGFGQSFLSSFGCVETVLQFVRPPDPELALRLGRSAWHAERFNTGSQFRVGGRQARR